MKKGCNFFQKYFRVASVQRDKKHEFGKENRLEITQVDSSGPPHPVPQYASYALRFPGPNEFRFGWYRSFLVVLFGSLSLHDNTGVGGNTGPKLSSLLTDGTGNGGTLHLTLVVDDL